MALEWQDPEEWRERALAERDPQASLTALLALVRASGRDQFHRTKADPPPASSLQSQILEALGRLDWNALNDAQRLELVRVYGLALIRLEGAESTTRQRLLDAFEPRFPASSRGLNSELCELLVYLESPNVAREAMELVNLAPTQEEQLDYIKSLRVLKTGWTPDLRKEYFSWFRRAAGYRGGASFRGYLKAIKKDAIAVLSEQERMELQPLLEEPDAKAAPTVALASALAGRTVVREWNVAELAPVLKRGMKGRDLERGRRMFGATGCFACHRFANEGGAMGPDLTGVGRRFSPRDLLESILEPSRAISDLYGNTIMHKSDGESVIGRIVYLGQNTVQVNLNMFAPGETVRLDRKSIVSMERSPVSPMPPGLLNMLEEEEILDLMAYVLSGKNSTGN